MTRVPAILMTAYFLSPLVIAQCPDQEVLPTDGLDMSKVAINPVTGEPLVFCRKAVWAGHVVQLEVTVCDPDEHDPNSPPQELRLWHVVDDLDVDIPLVDGVGTLTRSYPTPGTYYETFGVTDGMDDENSVVVGTMVVDVYRVNRPPRLGCR